MTAKLCDTKLPIYELDKVLNVYPILCAQGNQVIADFWQVQFNMGLRFSDCVSITVGEAKYALKFGDLHKVESKTGKERLIGMNDEVRVVFERLIVGKVDSDYLFVGGGKNKTVHVDGMNNGFYSREYYAGKLKAVAELLGLDSSFVSTHTARKSWAYHQKETLGVPLEKVSESMGHSSIAITRRYAGISNKEISEMGRRSFR